MRNRSGYVKESQQPNRDFFRPPARMLNFLAINPLPCFLCFQGISRIVEGVGSVDGRNIAFNENTNNTFLFSN